MKLAYPELKRDRKKLATLNPRAQVRFLQLFSAAARILKGTGYLFSYPGSRSARRTVEQQWKLFIVGRRRVGDGWVRIPGAKVLTNCDGIVELSNHQLGWAGDKGLRRRRADGGVGEFLYYGRGPKKADRLFEKIVKAAAPLGISCGHNWTTFKGDHHHFEIDEETLV